jgi:peptidoglycan hydrolase-like protein with peptidoglycan-binding domain
LSAGTVAQEQQPRPQQQQLQQQQPQDQPVEPDPYIELNRQVQERLRQLGFYNGPVNGVIGPNTQAAIAQFQLSWPMPVNGMLDADTLAALGVPPREGEAPNAPAREAPPPGQG